MAQMGIEGRQRARPRDYNRIADRDENEAMGIFKAQMAILPDFKGIDKMIDKQEKEVA